MDELKKVTLTHGSRVLMIRTSEAINVPLAALSLRSGPDGAKPGGGAAGPTSGVVPAAVEPAGVALPGAALASPGFLDGAVTMIPRSVTCFDST
jgi:hypothetical protein